jgi:DNA mismatch endonuclease (patch repair protein)
MRRNADRDRRSTSLAEEAGWRVVRVWECQVREEAEKVVSQVLGG